MSIDERNKWRFEEGEAGARNVNFSMDGGGGQWPTLGLGAMEHYTKD